MAACSMKFRLSLNASPEMEKYTTVDLLLQDLVKHLICLPLPLRIDFLLLPLDLLRHLHRH